MRPAKKKKLSKKLIKKRSAQATAAPRKSRSNKRLNLPLTRLQQAEVMKAYNAYWYNYLEGNVKAMSVLLDDKYTQVGSAEGEVFYNKKEAVQFLYNTIDQVAGKLEMRSSIR
jgi:hypothetical protein